LRAQLLRGDSECRGNPDHQLLDATMDLLFLGIVVYEGYKLSSRDRLKKTAPVKSV
jgi:hypothetical protein